MIDIRQPNEETDSLITTLGMYWYTEDNWRDMDILQSLAYHSLGLIIKSKQPTLLLFTVAGTPERRYWSSVNRFSSVEKIGGERFAWQFGIRCWNTREEYLWNSWVERIFAIRKVRYSLIQSTRICLCLQFNEFRQRTRYHFEWTRIHLGVFLC